MSSDVEPMDLCDTKQTLEQILDKGRNVAETLGDMIVSLEDHVAQDVLKSVLALQNVLSKAQCDLTHKLNAFEDPPLPVNLLGLKDTPCHGTVALTAKALDKAGMPPMSIYQDSGPSGPLSFTQTTVPNASVFTPEGQFSTCSTESPRALATPIAIHAKRVTKGRNTKGAATTTTVQPRRFSRRLASRKNHVPEAVTGTYVPDQEDAPAEANDTTAVTLAASDVQMHECQILNLPAACGSAGMWKAVEDRVPPTPTHLRVKDNSTTRGLKRTTGGAAAAASGRVEKRRFARLTGATAKRGGRGGGSKGKGKK